MRDDMDKVINEPGRRHGIDRGMRSNRRAAHLDPESADAFRSMKQPHRNYAWGNTKEKSSNWTVFSKFLKSRVGKKWDDVYSEIRKTVNTDNPMVKMVTEHAATLHLNCYFDDAGNLWSNTRSGPVSVGSDWRYSCEEFYVHPDTGVLCIVHKSRKKYKHPNQTPEEKMAKVRYVVPGTHSLVQYFKIPEWAKTIKDEYNHYSDEYRHIWYKVELRRATPEEIKMRDFGYLSNYRVPVSELEPRPFKPKAASYWISESGVTKYSLLVTLHCEVFNNKYRRSGYWEAFTNLFGGNYAPVSMTKLTGKELKKMEKMFS
jgi:hypothetical protein